MRNKYFGRKTLKNKRMKQRGIQTLKKKDSFANFIKLAKKYKLVQSGSKKQIAERLSALRGKYLSKTEKKLILPYLSNNVNKKLLLKD
uniref:Uncharacterized protein n=1 Tax=viral metagenome TaxID=1070528 RepID=A0A6C0KZU4_9ZZZZ|tara:strand:- start:8061 stop:8324 length:264 start_codon:yes stop_codon:yes gene_type:complete